MNNKGYLLVEIIVAFTIAMIMTFFLLQMVISLKDLNEDYYVETKLENDQILMTKCVMDDINQYVLEKVDKSGDSVLLTFKDKDREFTKKLLINNTMFQYGEYDVGSSKYIEKTLFTKTLDDSLNISEPFIDIMCFNGSGYSSCVGDEEHKQLNIKFSAKTIYSDVDYGISLSIPYKYDEIKVYSGPNMIMTRSYIQDDYVIGSNSIKSDKIEKIKLLSSSNVPASVPSSKVWDVSDRKNESILAWYTDIDSNGKYELYIGQDGGVIANTDSSYLFSGYTNLLSIDGLDNLDTSNVENMIGMFNGCKSITSLKLDKFDTSNVTDMSTMFSGMYNLVELDISKFDTSNVTDMNGMFSACRSITSLKLDNFDTSHVQNMEDMFFGMSSLVELDVSDFDTSSVTYMRSMFSGLGHLENLDIKNFDTSKVTNMAGMFHSMSKIVELDISNFDTSNVVNMGQGTDYISGDDWGALSYGMFSSCTKLERIIFGPKFNTSKVRNMKGMFAGDISLKELDVSKFNTSLVVDMADMFSGLRLKSLDLSNFNTKNVKNMGSKNMEFTYDDINKIYYISAYTDGGMFQDCTYLQTITFGSYFDTSNVVNMQGMFAGMRDIETLNINMFNTSNVTDMAGMFNGMKSIKNIYVSNKWSTSKVTNSLHMFTGSTNLPNYNSNVVDKTKAHYNNGGYLRYKAV